MLSGTQTIELKKFAAKIRIETIKQIGKRGFGHVGGSMSIVEVLSVLYGGIMRVDPENPRWEDRDWLVCSKGHAGPAVYSTLALRGFFPLDWLDTLNQPHTNLPSHCDRNRTPGVDMTTGSLGQGISVAAGIAKAYQLNGAPNQVFCIVGDGECQEGQVWEAVSFAAQNKLDNFILLVDDNKVQLDGPTAQIDDLESFSEKLRAFHWDVCEVDGHDIPTVHEALERSKAARGKPQAIILNTVKGKGCCFAEGRFNHHIQVSAQETAEAVAVLERELKDLAAQ